MFLLLMDHLQGGTCLGMLHQVPDSHVNEVFCFCQFINNELIRVHAIETHPVSAATGDEAGFMKRLSRHPRQMAQVYLPFILDRAE
jgi:hypothetical protein